MVYNAVKFRGRHRRGSNHHRILDEKTLAFLACLLGQCQVVRAESFQIIVVRDVARVDAAFFVAYNYVDGQLVEPVLLAMLWQQVELVHPAGSLTDTPAKGHVEFQTIPTTKPYKSRHIESFRDSDHRHGRRHPQLESSCTTCILGIDFLFHFSNVMNSLQLLKARHG